MWGVAGGVPCDRDPVSPPRVPRGTFYQGYRCSRCRAPAHKECLGRVGTCGKAGTGEEHHGIGGGASWDWGGDMERKWGGGGGAVGWGEWGIAGYKMADIEFCGMQEDRKSVV